MKVRVIPFRRHHRSAGFTLVEMLIGLTLFALLSVLLFGGFHFGLRAWETGGARAAQASEIQLVQEMLRRQIAAAQPPATEATETTEATPATAAAPSAASFSGTARSLTFVARLPGRSGAAGLYRFDIAEAPDGSSGRQLALGWSALGQNQPDTATPVETLLRGIAAISFAYYGRAVPEAPAQWQDRWNESLGLPELVRLSVTFPPGDNRSWPDLFVAPRLRVSGPLEQAGSP